jgi:hypothetical protein
LRQTFQSSAISGVDCHIRLQAKAVCETSPHTATQLLQRLPACDAGKFGWIAIYYRDCFEFSDKASGSSVSAKSHGDNKFLSS